MGDMGDIFRAMKEIKKTNKENRLASADSAGWQVLNAYHWRKPLGGKFINYWPSTGTVMYGEKRTVKGSNFYKKLMEKYELESKGSES